MLSEEEEPRKAPALEIGQPLELLSVAEIDCAIEALRGEISRLETARATKLSANAAAEGFFKK